ncbi:MAG: M20/M25/M40 family metallo-hydrolase, partial [Xanthomonadales bacterium]|nr:M20/M25/M40 family metallo-hydrolase [Xanthomonadales bacterium]
MSDHAPINRFVNEKWDREVIPELSTYIKIPNKSPMFDPQWSDRGYMTEAMDLLETWARDQPIPGMQIERINLPGRTPLLLIEIPGKGEDTVLMYGHMDKQPEMLGWNVDLGPWTPVLSQDKLYGRGGADDGYALYASLIAVMALHERGL